MAIGTIARIHYRQMFGVRRIAILCGFLALPFLLTVAIRAVSGSMPRERDTDPVLIFEFLLYAQAISLLVALLGGSLFLATELGGRTLTYLFTRPTPKWRLLIEKYIVQLVVTVPFILASFTMSHLVLGFRGGLRAYLALCACIVASSAVYNAIFMFWGVLIPRRAMVFCIVYAGLIEAWLSVIPVAVNQFTAAHYLRLFGLSAAGMEIDAEMRMIVGTPDLIQSTVGLGLIIAVSIGGSMLLLKHREYKMSEQV